MRCNTTRNGCCYNVYGSNAKSAAMCVFELVNVKNPSSGMIRPGNCLWFHNLMLALTGSIGDDYKKLMKNHACIHDACEFMMSFHENGPGYIFGMFTNAL